MPRSIWSGIITFGMVSMPVKLFAATENKDIAFHQVHNVCDSRIKYQKWCPHCQRTVENDEIEKGYEYSRGHYVLLNNEDFEQLPLPSKHTILVSAFVKIDQIDPIYFENSYYVEPDQSALRPFILFMKAMTDMNTVAVAAVTLRNKERLCTLRVADGTLVLETLLYPDEIRVGENTRPAKVDVSAKELKMAEHLIELMQQDFDPSQYEDHYREALRKVIEAKLEGKEIVEEPTAAPRAKVVDLMDALRASVDNVQQIGTKPRKKTEPSKSSRRSSSTTGRGSSTAANQRKTARSTSKRTGKRKESA